MNFIFSKEEKELIAGSMLRLAEFVGKKDKSRALRILKIVEKTATNNRIVKLNKKQAEAIVYFCAKLSGELAEITIPEYLKRIEKNEKDKEKYKTYIENATNKIKILHNLGRKVHQKLIMRRS